MIGLWDIHMKMCLVGRKKYGSVKAIAGILGLTVKVPSRLSFDMNATHSQDNL